ncbi:hypothetical protein D3C71_2232250 [compost metagenome]
MKAIIHMKMRRAAFAVRGEMQRIVIVVVVVDVLDMDRHVGELLRLCVDSERR